MNPPLPRLTVRYPLPFLSAALELRAVSVVRLAEAAVDARREDELAARVRRWGDRLDGHGRAAAAGAWGRRGAPPPLGQGMCSGWGGWRRWGRRVWAGEEECEGVEGQLGAQWGLAHVEVHVEVPQSTVGLRDVPVPRPRHNEHFICQHHVMQKRIHAHGWWGGNTHLFA